MQAFRHLGSILAPLRQEQEDLKRRLEDAGGLERAALEAQLKRIEDTTILLSAWELALSEMKVARNKVHLLMHMQIHRVLSFPGCK